MKNIRRREIIEERIRHYELANELAIEKAKKIILRYRKDLVSPVVMEYEIT